MKTINKHPLLVLLILFAGLSFANCESDPSSSTSEDSDQQDPSEVANTISNNLTFEESKVEAGKPPQNSNLADLKIDKESINLLPGIKNRIRIQTNGVISVFGVLVSIPGADNYHNVTPIEDESSDSISVIYVDIDPADMELPLDNTIFIAPIDGNGDVIDEFNPDLHIDPPFDDNEITNSDSDTCPPALDKNLRWKYTEANGEFFSAPGHRKLVEYEVKGCCFNGVSSPCGSSSPNATVLVDQQGEQTNLELIKFFDDGTNQLTYELDKTIVNYDPATTDFCAGQAGYSRKTGFIGTDGRYSMNPLNGFDQFYSITIDSINIDINEISRLGFGPQTLENDQPPYSNWFEYFLGCRHYIERRDIEGGVLLRVFEIDSDDGIEWYD